MTENEKLKPIKTGMFVKVRLTDGENVERIWAEVLSTDVEKQELHIRLDNYPVSPAFKFNELMTIPVAYVLDVLDEADDGEK